MSPAPKCSAVLYLGWLLVRCQLQPGHEPMSPHTHQARPGVWVTWEKDERKVQP